MSPEYQNQKTITGNHFIEGTGPTIRSGDGVVVVDHATEIPYGDAESLWIKRNLELEGIRSNYQVAILPTEGDVTSKLIESPPEVLTKHYPINTFERRVFPDGENLLLGLSEAPAAEHVYIVASVDQVSAFADTQRVAWHYKNVLHAEHVTLIASFLAGTRQDKNVNKQGDYVATPVNIAADVEGLTRVDTIMCIEPHSFATQAAAATFDKPFFPITPWRFLMNRILRRGIRLGSEQIKFTKNNTVTVRPDQGRNIAATRISRYYGFQTVSFDKIRLGDHQVYHVLRDPQDQKRVAGKICVCYDDEVATLATVHSIAERLDSYGARALVVVGVHGKLTGKWEENISHPLINQVIITDSRAPVGDIGPYIESGKIAVISLEELIKDILRADTRGVNFWNDNKYRHMVLQEQDGE